MLVCVHAVLKGPYIDGVVSLYDSNTLAHRVQMDITRGANVLAVNKPPETNAPQGNGDVLDNGGAGNLCVGLKRKLLVFECSGKDITMKKVGADFLDS